MAVVSEDDLMIVTRALGCYSAAQVKLGVAPEDFLAPAAIGKALGCTGRPCDALAFAKEPVDVLSHHERWILSTAFLRVAEPGTVFCQRVAVAATRLGIFDDMIQRSVEEGHDEDMAE